MFIVPKFSEDPLTFRSLLYHDMRTSHIFHLASSHLYGYFPDTYSMAFSPAILPELIAKANVLPESSRQ
jgi:hypothetical protein